MKVAEISTRSREVSINPAPVGYADTNVGIFARADESVGSSQEREQRGATLGELIGPAPLIVFTSNLSAASAPCNLSEAPALWTILIRTSAMLAVWLVGHAYEQLGQEEIASRQPELEVGQQTNADVSVGKEHDADYFVGANSAALANGVDARIRWLALGCPRLASPSRDPPTKMSAELAKPTELSARHPRRKQGDRGGCASAADEFVGVFEFADD